MPGVEAKNFKASLVGTEHLLLSILKDQDNAATRTLVGFGIDYKMVVKL
jgi:ATP-dependent Clp protease ATP-binding subunit ClpC